MDTTAPSYVNLERSNIVIEETSRKSRSGRLLGEYVNEGKHVMYNIPSVSHQWQFTGHVTSQPFPAALGHVFD